MAKTLQHLGAAVLVGFGATCSEPIAIDKAHSETALASSKCLPESGANTALAESLPLLQRRVQETAQSRCSFWEATAAALWATGTQIEGGTVIVNRYVHAQGQYMNLMCVVQCWVERGLMRGQ